jgi:hypothetical protein
MRPQSITNFAWLYIVSIVLGLVSGIWLFLHPELIPIPPGSPPEVAGLMANIMPVIMIVSAVGGFVVNLLLLFFIARRGSEVAKWIFIGLCALGILSLVRSLVTGVMLHGPIAWVAGVQALIQLVMIWLLLRPDAKPWFEKKVSKGPDPEIFR